MSSSQNNVMTQCTLCCRTTHTVIHSTHTPYHHSIHCCCLAQSPPPLSPPPIPRPHTPNSLMPAVTAAGQYNDLATPFMSMPGDTIRHIFSVEGGTKGREDYTICDATSACHFTARSLGILSAFYLMLMALASGVAVPGGLFMPSIMVRKDVFDILLHAVPLPSISPPSHSPSSPPPLPQ